MRLTIACPEALIQDANQLALAIGLSPADVATYRVPSWQDSEGNLYAACSLIPSPEWVQTSLQPLQQPSWAAEGEEPVDLEAASRAQALITLWMPSEEHPTPPLASPEIILAVAGDDGVAMLAAMGLTRVEEDGT